MPVDADSALSMGAVVGFVAVINAAATTAGEVTRGGLALALLGDPDRRRAVRARLTAHALAGATFGLFDGRLAALLEVAIAPGPLDAAS